MQIAPYLPTEPIAPTVLSVTNDYLKRPIGVRKLLLRPPIKVLDWADVIVSGLRQPLKECRTLFGRTNHFLGYCNFPEKIIRFARSVKFLGEQIHHGTAFDVSRASTKVFRSAAVPTGMIADTCLIAHGEGLLSLSLTGVQILNTVGFLGSFSLFIKSVFDLKPMFEQLQMAKQGEYPLKLALMNCLYKVSRLALGLFGMLIFAVGGGLATKVALLAVSSCTLALSISRYYYKKLYLAPDS